MVGTLTPTQNQVLERNNTMAKWNEMTVANRYDLVLACDPMNNHPAWLKLCKKISEKQFEDLTASQKDLVSDLCDCII